MKFDAIHCFSEIVIMNDKLNENAYRMQDLKVFVVNTKTGTESLCGVLKMREVWTVEGQTYKISCDLKCGNEVKLTVRHNSGEYNNLACIHMSEIKAYRGKQDQQLIPS